MPTTKFQKYRGPNQKKLMQGIVDKSLGILGKGEVLLRNSMKNSLGLKMWGIVSATGNVEALSIFGMEGSRPSLVSSTVDRGWIKLTAGFRPPAPCIFWRLSRQSLSKACISKRNVWILHTEEPYNKPDLTFRIPKASCFLD